MSKQDINLKRMVTAVTICAIVFIMAVIGQTIFIVKNNNEVSAQNFSDGVSISGVDVGGLSIEEAYLNVANFLSGKIENFNLELTYEELTWKFTKDDFEVQENVQAIIDEAYTYHNKILNRDPNIELEIINAEGMIIETRLDYLFSNIKEKINEVIKEIEISPKNSKVDFDPERDQMFVYSESLKGLRVNKNKLYKKLEIEFNTNSENISVEITTREVNPKITESYLEDKTQLVSIFSTSLHNSAERRLHNVAYALSKFNGMIIKPEQIVSFNEVTGPQTLKGGYKKSIIIYNGVFVEGVGGGLCQASTTLYNASILAGLEIIEVNKHTLPVGYIELALDAMVSENWSDFIFKNSSLNNLYLKCYVKNARAYVEIYGKTLDNGITLKRRAKFIKTIPHYGDVVKSDIAGEYESKVIYKGEKFRVKYPKEGYEAKAYLQYFSGGQLVKEEEIRHEIYEPQPGLVIEGAEEFPDNYEIPESEVKIIKAQKNDSETTASNVASVLLQQNPTNYNP